MSITTTLATGATGATGATENQIYSIKQGDAIYIPVQILVDGAAVTAEDVPLLDKLEFMIGKCVRSVVNAADAWSDEEELFFFHITQANTLWLRPGIYQFDLRVKFANGDVVGMNNIVKIRIVDSMSRGVIQ